MKDEGKDGQYVVGEKADSGGQALHEEVELGDYYIQESLLEHCKCNLYYRSLDVIDVIK